MFVVGAGAGAGAGVGAGDVTLKEKDPTVFPPTAQDSDQLPTESAVMVPDKEKFPEPSVDPIGLVTELDKLPAVLPVTVTPVLGGAPEIATVHVSPGWSAVDPRLVVNDNWGL